MRLEAVFWVFAFSIEVWRFAGTLRTALAATAAAAAAATAAAAAAATAAAAAAPAAAAAAAAAADADADADADSRSEHDSNSRETSSLADLFGVTSLFTTKCQWMFGFQPILPPDINHPPGNYAFVTDETYLGPWECRVR